MRLVSPILVNWPITLDRAVVNYPLKFGNLPRSADLKIIPILISLQNNQQEFQIIIEITGERLCLEHTEKKNVNHDNVSHSKISVEK